jgi:phosphoglycerate dehydrogenase-like enzyme
MTSKFRVGLTRYFMKPDGSQNLAEYGLDGLDEAEGIEWAFLAEGAPEITPEQAEPFDALVVEAASVPAATVTGAGRLALVTRWGAGFDSVDVEACTRAGVVVTNAPDATARPMASANLAFILALSLRMLTKDRLTREGRWGEWPLYMGMGLTGRTLGLVGMGHIGRETLRLAAPLEMRFVVHDPFVSPDAVREAGASPVTLDELLLQSDIVCIAVPLTPQTRGLIGAEQIRLMKPTAYLVNTARGPIVDQQALAAALTEGRIQGAGLDVFEKEPIEPDDPLLRLDNVVLTPHALGCTDECFVLTGRSNVQNVLDVAHGRVPRFVVNPTVLNDPRLQERLRTLASA